jgi:ribosomal protein L11 methyltransferase
LKTDSIYGKDVNINKIVMIERLGMIPPHPCMSVAAPPELADEVSWEMAELGALAVEIRDETTLTATNAAKAELVAGFADAASRDRAKKELLKLFDGDLEITDIDIKEDGWSTRWKEFFRPVVLEKLQVVTPWMEPPRSDRTTIVIDPGQAFGTGGHATTQLILEMLERRSEIGDLPREALDLGCGSGILAVAAAKLGVKKITAVDIDEESIAATRANASANGVGGCIEAALGSARDLTRTWPLVLANLQLSVFKEHASDILGLVSPGGGAFLSGLLSDQATRCLALLPGFRLIETLERDGWAAVRIGKVR